jgi:hypothetical protein
MSGTCMMSRSRMTKSAYLPGGEAEDRFLNRRTRARWSWTEELASSFVPIPTAGLLEGYPRRVTAA